MSDKSLTPQDDYCETINLYAPGCNCVPQCPPERVLRGYHHKLCKAGRDLAAAYERCAQVCEEQRFEHTDQSGFDENVGIATCVKAIRSLSPAPSGGEV